MALWRSHRIWQMPVPVYTSCLILVVAGGHRLSCKFLSSGNFIDCLRVHDAEDPDRWEEACGNLALRVLIVPCDLYKGLADSRNEGQQA